VAKVKACYTCSTPGEWGPYHVLIPGPVTGQDRWGPTRDESQDKTLCGITLNGKWERDMVGISPTQVECKRCQAILAKQGKKTAKFPLGIVVTTPGAAEAFARTGEEFRHYLRKHVTGDWGDVSDDDAKENDYSVSRHLRIFSVYHLEDGTKIWVITEADRSVTTFLLPGEY